MVQLLHGVTFAMAHIAAIQYIQSEEQNKMVALQALYNAIPLGAFIALMTTLSGWGYELWGLISSGVWLRWADWPCSLNWMKEVQWLRSINRIRNSQSLTANADN